MLSNDVLATLPTPSHTEKHILTAELLRSCPNRWFTLSDVDQQLTTGPPLDSFPEHWLDQWFVLAQQPHGQWQMRVWLLSDQHHHRHRHAHASSTDLQTDGANVRQDEDVHTVKTSGGLDYLPPAQSSGSHALPSDDGAAASKKPKLEIAAKSSETSTTEQLLASTVVKSEPTDDGAGAPRNADGFVTQDLAFREVVKHEDGSMKTEEELEKDSVWHQTWHYNGRVLPVHPGTVHVDPELHANTAAIATDDLAHDQTFSVHKISRVIGRTTADMSFRDKNHHAHAHHSHSGVHSPTTQDGQISGQSAQPLDQHLSPRDGTSKQTHHRAPPRVHRRIVALRFVAMSLTAAQSVVSAVAATAEGSASGRIGLATSGVNADSLTVVQDSVNAGLVYAVKVPKTKTAMQRVARRKDVSAGITDDSFGDGEDGFGAPIAGAADFNSWLEVAPVTLHHERLVDGVWLRAAGFPSQLFVGETVTLELRQKIRVSPNGASQSQKSTGPKYRVSLFLELGSNNHHSSMNAPLTFSPLQLVLDHPTATPATNEKESVPIAEKANSEGGAKTGRTLLTKRAVGVAEELIFGAPQSAESLPPGARTVMLEAKKTGRGCVRIVLFNIATGVQTVGTAPFAVSDRFTLAATSRDQAVLFHKATERQNILGDLGIDIRAAIQPPSNQTSGGARQGTHGTAETARGVRVAEIEDTLDYLDRGVVEFLRPSVLCTPSPFLSQALRRVGTLAAETVQKESKTLFTESDVLQDAVRQAVEQERQKRTAGASSGAKTKEEKKKDGSYYQQHLRNTHMRALGLDLREPFKKSVDPRASVLTPVGGAFAAAVASGSRRKRGRE